MNAENAKPNGIPIINSTIKSTHDFKTKCVTEKPNTHWEIRSKIHSILSIQKVYFRIDIS